MHSKQKTETIQGSTTRWMDKQNVIHIEDGIFFSHKEKWNSDTWYTMNEPWRNHIKRKKLDIKRTNTEWFHLYEIPRIGKSIKTSGCQGLRKRTEGWRERGHPFWVIKTSRIDQNWVSGTPSRGVNNHHLQASGSLIRWNCNDYPVVLGIASRLNELIIIS